MPAPSPPASVTAAPMFCRLRMVPPALWKRPNRSGPFRKRTLQSVCNPGHLDADAAEHLQSCALLAAYRRALNAKHGSKRSGPLLMRTLELQSCALLAAYRRALNATHGSRRSGPLLMRTLRSVCSPAQCSQHIADRLMLSMARSMARSDGSVLKTDAADRLQSCALLAAYRRALTAKRGSRLRVGRTKSLKRLREAVQFPTPEYCLFVRFS